MSEDRTTESAAGEAGEAGATTVAAALLTATQAAQVLGISTRRLRDWRKEGRIAEVGRFKRGTARVPLFDPADVTRLKDTLATEEAPATVATTVMDSGAIAAEVARQVRRLLAERAEAEAATVAPLVELVREQQQTIDELRRRAEAAEAEASRHREERAVEAALFRQREEREAAQAAQDAPGAGEARAAAQGAAPGLWARLRRAWRGGAR